MRKLKFRFWNKDDKVLWENEEIAMIIIEKDKISPLFDTGAEYRDIGGNIVTMQYTGLIDKNGKEIYEGDIVRYFKDELGVVDFVLGSFIVDSTSYTDTFYELMGEIEVIGNIYENSELIG